MAPRRVRTAVGSVRVLFDAPFFLINSPADAPVPASACTPGCRRHVQREHLIDLLEPRRHHLLDLADGIGPAEALLDTLAALHRYAVAVAVCDPIGDRRAVTRGVLRHVRLHCKRPAAPLTSSLIRSAGEPPVVRKQFVEATAQLRRQTFEHVFQAGPRIVAAELRRLHQAHHDRCALPLSVLVVGDTATLAGSLNCGWGVHPLLTMHSLREQRKPGRCSGSADASSACVSCVLSPCLWTSVEFLGRSCCRGRKIRLQFRSSSATSAKNELGNQRLAVLVNVSFPAPNTTKGSAPLPFFVKRQRRGSKAVMHRIANPCRSVRLRPAPPNESST